MLSKIFFSGIASLAIMTAAHAGHVGYTDTLNQNSDGALRGWVCNTDAYGAVVKVLVYRDGRYVGRTTSYTDYRPDAQAFCGGNTYGGWKFVLPVEELDGNAAIWVAKVDLESGEQTIPYAGGGSALVGAPGFIGSVTYVSPSNFSYGLFADRPGQILDTPHALWGFAVKVSGVIPFAPVVSWDAGIYTGTPVPSSLRNYTQVGDDRTSGSEFLDTQVGRSMLQLYGNSAGFMLNNFWLDPAQSISGPTAQFGISYGIMQDRLLTRTPALQNILSQLQPFRTSTFAAVHRPFATANTSLVVSADVVVPSLYVEPVAGATQNGQANFYLEFWDTKNGGLFAYVLGIWNNTFTMQAPSAAGSDEFGSYAAQSAGFPSGPFATWESGQFTPGATFPSDRHFQARITRSSLQTAINSARSNGANLSENPSDYVLTDATVGIETLGPKIAMSASARNFTVYMTRF